MLVSIQTNGKEQRQMTKSTERKADRREDEWRRGFSRSICTGRVEVPQGEQGLFSTMWGEKDDMFPLWGVECVRKGCAVMERCMRGECVTTALCGVTDGASERQTQLSERGRHAGSPDSSSPPWLWERSHARPILSCSHQSFWFDLEALGTSSCCFSGSTSRGNPIETITKKRTTRTPEVSEEWEAGSRRVDLVTGSPDQKKCGRKNDNNKRDKLSN